MLQRLKLLANNNDVDEYKQSSSSDHGFSSSSSSSSSAISSPSLRFLKSESGSTTTALSSSSHSSISSRMAITSNNDQKMLSKSLSDLMFISNSLPSSSSATTTDNSCSSSSSSSECLGTLKYTDDQSDCNNSDQSVTLSDYSSSSSMALALKFTGKQLMKTKSLILQNPVMITFPRPEKIVPSLVDQSNSITQSESEDVSSLTMAPNSIDNQSDCSELTLSSTIQHFGQCLNVDQQQKQTDSGKFF